jgi:polyisoprenyl-teichoic acid--peptidoglycan teichoic acid transferase
MRYVNLKTPKKKSGGKNQSKSSNKKRLALVTAVALITVVTVLFLKIGTGGALDPISIVASVSGFELKETDGRTNVLILGSDKRSIGEIRHVLTDTILVASIGSLEGDVVLISLPRDLWVESTVEPQRYQKINAMYAIGGAENIQKVVENVLGIPIHYYALVDFHIFEESVNILEGIQVDVENAFIDRQYPIEGMEDDLCGRTEEEIEEYEGARKDNGDEEDDDEKKDEEEKERIPEFEFYFCRYETISFEAGLQFMDGETALKFTRSRHGNNNEGNDFARARRQQRVIMAIKDKALSLTTIINPTRLKELYDIYSDRVDTNIDLQTAQNFYLLSQKINFEDVRSIVLDDRSSAEFGGLLYAPTDTSLYGAYVLIPRAGDFSQVHAYVQKYFFEKR